METEERSIATTLAVPEESVDVPDDPSEPSRPASISERSEEPTGGSINSSDPHLARGLMGTTEDAQDDDDQTVNQDGTRESHDASDRRDSPDSEDSEEEDRSEWVRKQPKVTKVRWSNYEAFMNRFSRDEGFDIIEVLAGHADAMSKEISQENARRRRKKQTPSLLRHPDGNEYKFIHQVRIQSPAILHILSRLTAQDDWSIDEPVTFLRPFQTLYYSFPLAKQSLEVLKRRANTPQTLDPDTPSTIGPLPSRTTASAQKDESEDPLHRLCMPSDVDLEDIVFGLPDLHSGVEHMQLYIDFVEKHVVPMWTEAAGTTRQKVRFSDLPMYFRPGDILYEPQETNEDKDKAGKAGSYHSTTGGLAVFQSYWKLCDAYMEEMELDPPKDNAPGVTRLAFSLDHFHIDFDGEKYGPIPAVVNIYEYEGEKDIRTLTMYPLRFRDDEADIRSKLTTRAENFLFFVQQKHLYYDGWTLIHSTYPSGKHGIKSSDSEKVREDQVVEHVEGEIMVDFKEGFQSGAEFVKPQLALPADFEGNASSPNVMPTIIWWSDRTRSKMQGYIRATIETVGRFSILQSHRMVQKDRVLKVFEETERVFDFDSDHKLLFPQRLIAYSFRARKFFVANVDSISVISTPKNSFRDLKVDIEHKRILESLVGSHFQKQDTRRQNKDAVLDQDFIRGKGSGLVILLHGVPGVGKTTTAEAVALTNRKPLFALTSGDLGSTPKDVEKALRETFRLATLWDCVLLLDEADLFLAKRDVGDLVRNSLVSVFLRVLDYYDGVLFLTTNRVGTVDEAFRSRIHLTLYYPPLKRKQTMEIFKLNIQRVKEIENSRAELHKRQGEDNSNFVPIEIDENSILDFAIQHWEETRVRRDRRWNGRQIRNAFQVAYSLVHFSRLNSTRPEHHEHEEDYDDDVSDDDEDYNYGGGEENAPDYLSPRSKGKDIEITAAASPSQDKNKGKLDSYQFKIVARSIRRFDDYLEFTRGRDSDYAKVMLLRRDDFVGSDDEWEDTSLRAGRRFLGGHPSRFTPGRAQNRSSVPPEYVSTPSDRGGRMRRGPIEERWERPRGGDRRATKSDDLDEEEYVEETPLSRRRRGAPAAGTTRNRGQRGYDDEEEDYDNHGRYRK